MYDRIIAEFLSTPWAIIPEKLTEISAFLSLAAAGKLDPAQVKAAYGGAQAPQTKTAGAVQVIPVNGVISQRMNLMSEFSGGTSTQGLAKQIRGAVADPAVGAIVLDVSSPGGSVYGVEELAQEIYNARGDKKIVAVANSLMASAAYWISSAADEIVVTPGGELGSIGVIAAHTDRSKAMDALGVKTTYISAGKYKTEGNPDEPLSEDAQAFMQQRVNEYYDAFTKAVARGRGATAAAVRSGYGQGRVVGAAEAVSLGLADRVDTLDATIARLSTPRAQRSRRNAAAQRLEIEERI